MGRQPVQAGAHLPLEDVDGQRFYAIIINIPGGLARAEVLEHYHRLRGGVPDEALQQLKGDFSLQTPRCATSLTTGCGPAAGPGTRHRPVRAGAGATGELPSLPQQAAARLTDVRVPF